MASRLNVYSVNGDTISFSTVNTVNENAVIANDPREALVTAFKVNGYAIDEESLKKVEKSEEHNLVNALIKLKVKDKCDKCLARVELLNGEGPVNTYVYKCRHWSEISNAFFVKMFVFDWETCEPEECFSRTIHAKNAKKAVEIAIKAYYKEGNFGEPQGKLYGSYPLNCIEKYRRRNTIYIEARNLGKAKEEEKCFVFK